MWIVVVAVIMTAFMYGWYVIWWALGIAAVLGVLALLVGDTTSESQQPADSDPQAVTRVSAKTASVDPSPLRAGPVQFAQSLSAVARRDADGAWRCPKCGSSTFHPVRKTATKVMFGFASLLGPARHVRCVTCTTLYRAD